MPLALVSAASSATLAYLVPARRVLFAVAGASTVGTLVWTRAAMMGTISSLLGLAGEGEGEGKKGEKVDAAEVEMLLRRWKWMNVVRAGFGLVGGLVGLWAVLE